MTPDEKRDVMNEETKTGWLVLTLAFPGMDSECFDDPDFAEALADAVVAPINEERQEVADLHGTEFVPVMVAAIPAPAMLDGDRLAEFVRAVRKAVSGATDDQ